MLIKENQYKTVVLIGSSSEIGLAIIKKLPLGESVNILFIGRSNPKDFIIPEVKVQTDFFKFDLENFEKLENVAEKLSKIGIIDLAIVAAGHLPNEHLDLDPNSVFKSMNVNTVGITCMLSTLASQMRSQDKGKIALISSVAEFRPRSQNFTYGASKSGADFFARGLANKYRHSGLIVTIIRPGYTFTKLSKGFKPAPFAIHPADLASIVVKGLERNKKIIYTPRILRYIVPILRILPNSLFEKLSSKK